MIIVVEHHVTSQLVNLDKEPSIKTIYLQATIKWK